MGRRVCAGAVLSALAGSVSGAGAQAVRLLSDINQAPASIITSQGVSLGEGSSTYAYFLLADPANGADVWRTDGTPAGTSILVDVNTTSPMIAGVAGDSVIFGAGSLLLMSPGTPGVVASLPSFAGLPQVATQTAVPHARLNGHVYFPASFPSRVNILASDGTPDGTSSFYAPTASVTIPSLASTPSRVFALVRPSTGPHALLASDGVTDFTTVRTFGLANAPIGSVGWLTPAGSSVFFVAPDATNKRQIWVSDGTDMGTAQVSAFPNPVESFDSLTWNGSRLAFVGPPTLQTGSPIRWLWTCDGAAGSAARTDLQEPIISPASTTPAEYSPLRSLVTINNEFAFLSLGASGQSGLRVGDGTTAGSRVLATGPFPPSAFIGVTRGSPDLAYFTTGTIGSSTQLWRTDGTQAGTVQINVLSDALTTGGYRSIATLGSRFIFAIQNGNDWSVWITTGTTAGSTMLVGRGVPSTTANSLPAGFTRYAGQTVFSALTQPTGVERYRSGSGAGTAALCEESISGSINSSGAPIFAVADGKLFSQTRQHRLVNGVTTVFDTLVVTTDPASLGQTVFATPASNRFAMLVSLSDRVIFNGPTDDAGGSTTDSTLWVSDGTQAGTHAIIPTGSTRPINPGSSTPTVWNGRVYVVATSSAGVGFSLWSSDGTSAGTTEVSQISTSLSLSFMNFLPLPDRLYFNRFDDALINRLWVTDGTPQGTHIVDASVAFSPAGATVGSLNSTLYVGGTLAGNEADLWMTNANDTALLPVATIRTTGSASIAQITTGHTTAGDRLFFSATDDTHGPELWVSDGTSAGTHLVTDLWPGPAGSSPQNVVAYGSGVVFTALSPATGRELWFSDGTEAGTRLIADINPGPGSSGPSSIIIDADIAYMSAARLDVGREPFAVRLTECVSDFNHDDRVDSADFFDFLVAFFAEAPSADVNHDATVNSQDFFDFLGAFFTRC